MLAIPVTGILSETIFSGLPDWFFLEEQTQYELYPKNLLIGVFVFQLILTGIFLPWIEELYFRSFLLPRISRLGAFAPVVGGLFFGLYHGWQLYGFVTVFLLGTALGFVVWWKKDLRLSVSLHIFANVITRLMFLMAAITM
jgi:membrane protease YdiL (CAAX protease family)